MKLFSMKGVRIKNSFTIDFPQSSFTVWMRVKGLTDGLTLIEMTNVFRIVTNSGNIVYEIYDANLSSYGNGISLGYIDGWNNIIFGYDIIEKKRYLNVNGNIVSVIDENGLALNNNIVIGSGFVIDNLLIYGINVSGEIIDGILSRELSFMGAFMYLSFEDFDGSQTSDVLSNKVISLSGDIVNGKEFEENIGLKRPVLLWKGRF